VVGAGIGVYLIISSPPVDKEKEEEFNNVMENAKDDDSIDWGDDDIDWDVYPCPECCEYVIDEDGNDVMDEDGNAIKVDPDCECKDDCN
tara:strand:+ start:1212 stop:1478 length:267 start_codon:yes stop_codon:yes gene_type:complete